MEHQAFPGHRVRCGAQWHFLFEMLICISFRFIKAVWKHVRKEGGALCILVLLIMSVEFMVLKDAKVIT